MGDSELKTNEVAFPRGGASALTPLEIKEIHNEAARDVLFEAESNKRKRSSSSTTNKKSKKAKKDDEEDKEAISIERFSIKSLVPGTSVLAQVIFVGKLELTVAIGDNLVGSVPITSVSAQVNAAIEAYEQSDDEDDEMLGAKFTPQAPELSKLFTVGQWVRAAVTSNGIHEKSGKRRLELTLEPEQVNAGMEIEDLVPHNVLQVSVSSVEDHGVIVSTGIDKVSGFISKKDLGNVKVVDGQLLLASVVSAKGRTVTLKPAEAMNKKSAVTTISSVDAIKPGMIVDALAASVSNGLTCRCFGMVDGSVSFSQLHVFDESKLSHNYTIGNPFKARVLGVLRKSGTPKLVLSTLDSVANLEPVITKTAAFEAWPQGSRFEDARVVASDDEYIYVQLSGEYYGQVHKSNLDPDAATAIESIYQVGTTHRARVTSYSTIDSMFILTMNPAKIDCEYMSIGDIPFGAVVPVEVIDVEGEGKGIKVQLVSGGFDAYVPATHVSDIKMLYPERKFKRGSKQTARVVSRAGRLLVSFKKSIMALEDDEIITNLEDVKVGQSSMATVEKFIPNGALVSFFGSARAFLSKNEISEVFVADAADHLRIGQTIKVKVLSKFEDDDGFKITVTCRQSAELGEQHQQALSTLSAGNTKCMATVSQKTKDQVVVDLEGLELRAVIPNGLLTDGNFEQNQEKAHSLSTGDKFEVLVLEKDERNSVIIATSKPSMLTGNVPVNYDEAAKSQGVFISGYIKSVTSMGLFVSFGNKCTGLVLARYAAGLGEDLSKAFYKFQSVQCQVVRTDPEHERFLLSLGHTGPVELLVNPLDKSKKSTAEFVAGAKTKARITKNHGSYLEFELADNCSGRMSASAAFASIDDVKDKKHPLKDFKEGKVIKVTCLGPHDPRSHRYLPFSERQAQRQHVVELATAVINHKPLAQYTPGEKVVCVVDRVDNGYVRVSLSPSIHGRVSIVDIEDDANLIPGQVLELTVVKPDSEHGVLLLSGRPNSIADFNKLKKGETLSCRVIKTKNNYVLVELGSGVVASAHVCDALDDYSQDLAKAFPPNKKTKCTVIDLDQENQKVAVSLRSENAVDPIIDSVADLERGQIVRGFINNTGGPGAYVILGRSVFALVRVTDLSDSYLADWKKHFKVGQMVRGKIAKCEEAGRVLMTLKESEVAGEIKETKRYDDIEVGDVFEGTVRSATDYGVFIKLDGCVNVSGLCYKSEISEDGVQDPSQLFGEGDRVKVKVIRKNPEKKQLSLGMKASYFTNEDSEQEADEDVEMEEVMDGEQEESSEEEGDDDEEEDDSEQATSLSTGGFDWTASILDQINDDDESESEDEDFTKKKKKSKKSKVEDKTGDLATKAPESVSDFERMLVGNPNSSVLWMNYMSFQLQLSDVDRAREIGKRALKTIAYREEQEKMNIWIAMLNLENTFGNDDSLEETFKDACQYMDSYLMHQKLASIFAMSDKVSQADDLYQKMIKKFGKEHLSLWTNYGTWLMDRDQMDAARALLAKALQTLPKRTHLDVVKKFAAMEFARGHLEQGRTLFEGLVEDAPKRIDLWNVYIDQEMKDGEKEKVEDLFDRVLTKKLTKKQAKFFFGKWLEFEEKEGDDKMQERVKAKAKAYVDAHNKE